MNIKKVKSTVKSAVKGATCGKSVKGATCG
jgi:hypothetical protein